MDVNKTTPDKSKHIQINLISRPPTQRIVREEVIYLDKSEKFVIELASTRQNRMNSDKEQGGRISLDEEFNHEINEEIGNKHPTEYKPPERFRTELNVMIDKIQTGDQLNEMNQFCDRFDANSNQINKLTNDYQINEVNNQINHQDNIPFNDDSNMSLSSLESSSSLSVLSRNFPEFFIKQQLKKVAPKQTDEIDTNSEHIPGILEKIDQSPISDVTSSLTSIMETVATNQEATKSTEKTKSNETAFAKFDSYEYDDVSSLDLDDDSISESIDNLEASIFGEPVSNQQSLQAQIDSEEFMSFLKHVDPKQFSQEDDQRLVSELIGDQSTVEEIQIVVQQHRSFEINKNMFDAILNKISAKLNLNLEITTNIVTCYLKGSTKEFIARFEQHLNYKIDIDLVTNVVKEFIYLENVAKLRNLKGLVLSSKKNRFDSFGRLLLKQCNSYENLALVYYLYHENTPNVYTNDELSLKILNNEQKIDSSLFDQIPDIRNSSTAHKELILINMLAHFLSKNDKLIEFLYNSREKPKFTIKLDENHSSDLNEKYKKWLHQRDIKMEIQSPVDILELIYAEELDLIRFEFNLSIIEKKSYQLLLNYFPYSDSVLLKKTFDLMWPHYFKSSLDSYFRYEMKVRSKNLLREDFELNLRTILSRGPLVGQTILCLEPKSYLFEEGIQYGIRKNDTNVLNSYFEFTSSSAFNEFLIGLYHSYKFTNIILTKSYYLYKLSNLVSKCLKDANISDRIRTTILQKDNTLIEKMNSYEKVNFYLDRFADPLYHWISFKEHMTVCECEYFHLMKPYFQDMLTEQFKRCISLVLVDVNTEDSLLKFVSGLNEQLAKNIIDYRRTNGPFYNRLQLKRVTGITSEVFRQCAGFLKINRNTILNFDTLDAQLLNVYDSTIIHPDMYDSADKILRWLNLMKADLGSKSTCLKCRSLLQKYGTVEIIKHVEQTFAIDPITTRIVFYALIVPLNFDYRTDSNLLKVA